MIARVPQLRHFAAYRRASALDLAAVVSAVESGMSVGADLLVSASEVSQGPMCPSRRYRTREGC